MADPVDPSTVFHPAQSLGPGMTPNLGGDGSNAVSRSIYKMIPSATDTDPDLTLEVYQKYNVAITDQRELHGNLILEA